MIGVRAVVLNVLLFVLVVGLAGTVQLQQLKQKIRKPAGILTGLGCQFVLLPAVGFLSAKAFQLGDVYAVTLLLVCSSPGGSYSNWWCSLFNADLALSVACTSISTLASALMLPLNIGLYVQLGYGHSVKLDWLALFAAIGVVLVGVMVGLLLGQKFPKLAQKMNAVGNLAGLLLIVASVVLSSTGAKPVWDQSPGQYAATALPCIVACVAALAVSSALGLSKPERVAVAIETCYQNTGIALSLCVASYNSEDAGRAASLILFYGIVQVLTILGLVLAAWQANWTLAARSDSCCHVVLRSYQPGGQQVDCPEAAASPCKESVEDWLPDKEFDKESPTGAKPEFELLSTHELEEGETPAHSGM